MFARAMVVAVAASTITSCQTAPTAPAPTRQATNVAASMAATWDAAVDYFAANNYGIANMDRSSGFIASEPLRVSRQDGAEWADCGRYVGLPLSAAVGTFNVLIRGDDAAATVQVTARWVQSDGDPCSTTGVWESTLERAIRDAAQTPGS